MHAGRPRERAFEGREKENRYFGRRLGITDELASVVYGQCVCVCAVGAAVSRLVASPLV